MALWLALAVAAAVVLGLWVPDLVVRHQLYGSIEAQLPAWQRAVTGYVRCVDPATETDGVTAEGLFWVRIGGTGLDDRLRRCAGQHLSSVQPLLDGSETLEDPLVSALQNFRRALRARRQDHGPATLGVDDRAIRDTCHRLHALPAVLGDVERALGLAPTHPPAQCTLHLPIMEGLRPPPKMVAEPPLDIQLRGQTVVVQFRPAAGGTRFGFARAGPPRTSAADGPPDAPGPGATPPPAAPVSPAPTRGRDGVGSAPRPTWIITEPMPALADGRDYGWDEALGLWTVGYETTAKRWRAYHWQGEWRALAWIPPHLLPDRVDWASATGDRVLVARRGALESVVVRVDEHRARGLTQLHRGDRFDPMTHVGATGSVTTVDLEFPAAGPHVAVAHLPPLSADRRQSFVPLAEARTGAFAQPHVVGCTDGERHWAVVGTRWLAPTEDDGDGRWWVLTSGDDGASWRLVGKTQKAWQLFGPVLACRGDALVNVTVSRRDDRSRTVALQCTPERCSAPFHVAEPAARHVGLQWGESGLDVVLAFRAHAVLLTLGGESPPLRQRRAFRRVPVRSAWDTIVRVDGRWFDLVTVDPRPW